MNDNILNFIKFSADNNQFKLSEAMFDNGITIRDKDFDIVSRLYKLFIYDRVKFVNVMRQAGYNSNADNYTTSKNFIEKISKSLNTYNNEGVPTKSFSRGDLSVEVASKWYDTVLNSLVGGETGGSTSSTTTTEPASGSQTKIIAIGLITMASIFGLIYFIIKK